MFVILLAIPLVSGALLTVAGERTWAPHLNIIASVGTFLASALLTMEIVTRGPRFAFGEQFFIDSMNVFFVAMPLKDLLQLFTQAIPLVSKEVVWHGHRARLGKGTVLVEVERPVSLANA